MYEMEKNLRILKQGEINQGGYIGLCSSQALYLKNLILIKYWNYKDSMCSVDK